MGKIIKGSLDGGKEKLLVNKYTSDYIKHTKDYAKLFEESPTFVTYFSMDHINSSESYGLGGVVEHVGKESPMRFNKINDLPIYGIDELKPSLDFDEDKGIDTSVEGQAVILPEVIEPRPNDYFIVSNLDNNDHDYMKLFVINNVEYSNINSNMYYQISYELTSGLDIESLVNDQTTEEYEVLYKQIGTGNSSLVTKSEFVFMSESMKLVNQIKEMYIDSFYNKRANIFALKEDKDITIDNNLFQFIKNNDVFFESRTYMENIYVEPIKISNSDYFKSIYYCIENYEKIKSLVSNYKVIYAESSGVLKHFRYGVKEVKYTKIEGSKSVFSLDINDLINNYENRDSLTGASSFEKILVTFLMGEETIDIDMIQEFLDSLILKQITNDLDLNDYISIPIFIYIVKSICEEIIKI